MKAAYKILALIGGIFLVVGCSIFAAFIINIEIFGAMVLIPLIFVVLGICFIVPGITSTVRQKKIMRLGKKYPAKIYDYTEDTSATVNGTFPVNTVVHYFDDEGRECERILETGFVRGSNAYPLGMTVDVYEYNGRIGWDKNSVRSEMLPDEEELMDNRPVTGAGEEVIVIECSGCGATFAATKGFVSKCPYCGRLMNADKE